MYKRFSLALAVTLLCTSFVVSAQSTDNQIIEKETVTKTEENALSFQKFSSCEDMNSVLKKYFKEALIEQVGLYSNAMPVEGDMGGSSGSK